MEELVKKIKTSLKGVKLKNSRISFMRSYVDEYGTNVVDLSGGLNGNGEWKKYFSDLSELFELFYFNNLDVWVISLHNDCLDDIFYLKIGVRSKNN